MTIHNIGFIGGGNMASALIGRLAGTLLEPSRIHVVDINADKGGALSRQWGVSTATRADAQLANCDVCVLAVKPQHARAAMPDLLPCIGSQLILSVVAGITTTDLSRWLNGHAAIVRTMPNTPALVGQGVTGMFAMSGTEDAQRRIADKIMRSVGQTFWVEKESDLDAVTAVSGSGPAYVFYFIEALQEAGMALGLDEKQAADMALATFRGAALLADQSGEPASVLREQVTSPGGTTFAALTTMEAGNLKALVARAVKAASDRSVELGIAFGQEA
jgi:pyrroline-5-carboxylate reductase